MKVYEQIFTLRKSPRYFICCIFVRYVVTISPASIRVWTVLWSNGYRALAVTFATV